MRVLAGDDDTPEHPRSEWLANSSLSSPLRAPQWGLTASPTPSGSPKPASPTPSAQQLPHRSSRPVFSIDPAADTASSRARPVFALATDNAASQLANGHSHLVELRGELSAARGSPMCCSWGSGFRISCSRDVTQVKTIVCTRYRDLYRSACVPPPPIWLALLLATCAATPCSPHQLLDSSRIHPVTITSRLSNGTHRISVTNCRQSTSPRYRPR